MAGDPTSSERDGVAIVGALAEPTRRRIYEHVVATGDWVGRDAAADAVGLERGTAAHHLDRLAADGLLEVDYKRLTGRQGPGAGRPAKVYRRARREVEVSLPPRDYELVGRMLAEAVDRSRTDDAPVTELLDEVASAEGAKLAESIRQRIAAADGAQVDKRAVAVEVLGEHGFEPQTTDDGTIVLRNCPFHQLAQQHTDLICGMNLCLVKAAVDGVGEAGLEARLEPEEGLCCVKLHPTA